MLSDASLSGTGRRHVNDLVTNAMSHAGQILSRPFFRHLLNEGEVDFETFTLEVRSFFTHVFLANGLTELPQYSLEGGIALLSFGAGARVLNAWRPTTMDEYRCVSGVGFRSSKRYLGIAGDILGQTRYDMVNFYSRKAKGQHKGGFLVVDEHDRKIDIPMDHQKWHLRAITGQSEPIALQSFLGGFGKGVAVSQEKLLRYLVSRINKGPVSNEEIARQADLKKLCYRTVKKRIEKIRDLLPDAYSLLAQKGVGYWLLYDEHKHC